VAVIAQLLEELAGFAKLFGPRALREVAADDDQIWLQIVDLAAHGVNEALVMSAEMKVRQMNNTGHVGLLRTRRSAAGSALLN
jgi:hypothetical protein